MCDNSTYYTPNLHYFQVPELQGNYSSLYLQNLYTNKISGIREAAKKSFCKALNPPPSILMAVRTSPSEKKLFFPEWHGPHNHPLLNGTTIKERKEEKKFFFLSGRARIFIGKKSF